MPGHRRDVAPDHLTRVPMLSSRDQLIALLPILGTSMLESDSLRSGALHRQRSPAALFRKGDNDRMTSLNLLEDSGETLGQANAGFLLEHCLARPVLVDVHFQPASTDKAVSIDGRSLLFLDEIGVGAETRLYHT